MTSRTAIKVPVISRAGFDALGLSTTEHTTPEQNGLLGRKLGVSISTLKIPYPLFKVQLSEHSDLTTFYLMSHKTSLLSLDVAFSIAKGHSDGPPTKCVPCDHADGEYNMRRQTIAMSSPAHQKRLRSLHD